MKTSFDGQVEKSPIVKAMEKEHITLRSCASGEKWDELSVDEIVTSGATKGKSGWCMKLKHSWPIGYFEYGGIFRIAQYGVGKGGAHSVHRATDGYTPVLISVSAAVLDG